MNLKKLKALKDHANSLPVESVEHLKAMATYHSESAEYWDNKVGSISNNDDVCTNNFNKHNRLTDKYVRLWKKAEKENEDIKYAVVNIFYDSGRKSVEIRKAKSNEKTSYIEESTYDQYIDIFPSEAEANKFAEETLQA